MSLTSDHIPDVDCNQQDCFGRHTWVYAVYRMLVFLKVHIPTGNERTTTGSMSLYIACFNFDEDSTIKKEAKHQCRWFICYNVVQEGQGCILDRNLASILKWVHAHCHIHLRLLIDPLGGWCIPRGQPLQQQLLYSRQSSITLIPNTLTHLALLVTKMSSQSLHL